MQEHASTLSPNSVEFPGVLLPSFQPTLQALQKMSQTLNLPFAEIIAPDSQTSAAAIRPPAYASRRGFSFNLDVLAGVPLTLDPRKPFDFTKLVETIVSRLEMSQDIRLETISNGAWTAVDATTAKGVDHFWFTPLLGVIAKLEAFPFAGGLSLELSKSRSFINLHLALIYPCTCKPLYSLYVCRGRQTPPTLSQLIR